MHSLASVNVNQQSPVINTIEIQWSSQPPPGTGAQQTERTTGTRRSQHQRCSNRNTHWPARLAQDPASHWPAPAVSKRLGRAASYRQSHFLSCRKVLPHEPQRTVVLCPEAVAFSTFAKLMFSALDIAVLKNPSTCIKGQFKILPSLWLRRCCIARNSRS